MTDTNPASAQTLNLDTLEKFVRLSMLLRRKEYDRGQKME